jgi:tetratricopeptide (TPR) repeat protein
MRRIAQARPLWKLTAAAAVLWCVSATAAEKAAPAASPKGADKPARVKPVNVAQKENLSASYSSELKKIYAEQDLKMAEAVRLVEEKKFREGVRIAEAVRDELKLQASVAKGEIISARLAEAESLVNRLRIVWGRERLRVANDAFINGNLPDAMIYAAEAARISPALSGEAEEMRKRCQGKERSEKFQKLSALSVANPDLKNLRNEAKNLIAEAKVFFENKRYPQALDKIEQVYLRDPFNMEAVALAGQIYRVFFSAGYYRHRADFELQSAYTTWQWVEPVFEAPEAPKEINIEIKKDSRKAMTDKLNTTILREYKYLKGDAKGAVDLLQRYLKQNKMDIDIQHNISPDDAAILGTVSLDLQNVSVGDVLRYISLMSGLKYRIDPAGVHIGTSVQTMYDRSYEIQPHVINMVYASTSSDASSGGGGDDSSASNIFRKRGADSKDSQKEKRLER